MKNIVEKIKDLQLSNVEDAKIMRILDLEETPEVILARYEAEKDLFTVEKAAEYLKNNIGGKEVWNKNKVLRLLNKGEGGEITPYELKPAKKHGYRIHKDELQGFVQEYKMTKEDWKKRAYEAEEELLKLHAEIEKIKKENEELKKSKTRNTKKNATENKE
ncbi:MULTISPECIES: hypothetical protein [Bacillus cereus group]|uniref:hypothetical protein n=1 Tax=Bacillus cereus group TaxID=86661 RepID=UPI001F56A279|nr:MULTISPECIES: hypothetical protein [Bacillus cereus group]MCR6463216.1 hypothetical protein [Bacillus paranthracis]